VEEPYVWLHGTVRGQQALDYFAHYGVGPTEEEMADDHGRDA
jgi:hypothetical protein